MIPIWLKLILILVLSGLLLFSCTALWFGKLSGLEFLGVVLLAILGIVAVLTVERLTGMSGKIGDIAEITASMERIQDGVEQKAAAVDSIGTHLGVVLAGEVIRRNRFAGEDYLTERVQQLKGIIELLEATGAEKEVQEIYADVLHFIVHDLKHGISRSSRALLQQSGTAINNVEFDTRFLSDYELGSSGDSITAFLCEKGIPETQPVEQAIWRLEEFLKTGRFHSAGGEFIYEFPVDAVDQGRK